MSFLCYNVIMDIPKYVETACKQIKKAGFESYIVGGCVRDLLLGKTPKDWDITTNAKPDDVLKIFDTAKYENDFGTVLLPIKNKKEEVLAVLEITTYRSEKGYSDNRHPDEVLFEEELDKDLERRDFTINALAMDLDNRDEVVDLFGGKKDLKAKIIRAVGEPGDRFREDALRMIRAIRFASQLGFEIEPKTERAITKMAGAIKFVAQERIRDEFVKILASDRPYEGVIDLYKTKLLQYILPELVQAVGVEQSRHHTYTVFKHLTLSLKHCPNNDWRVRFASLLHDIGKPKTRKIIKGIATFYNHEYVGERMVRKIMKRLKFSGTDSEKVINLVRNHMFYYNVGEVTATSVRRLIQKVGKENLADLIDIRIADRLGSGTPKAKPYKLRHLEYMLEKVQNDPVSVKMLKIDGNMLMKELSLEPGPKIGAILDVLLSEVIEDPKLNKEKLLMARASELVGLELDELRGKAKEAIEEKREVDDKKLKEEFYVK